MTTSQKGYPDRQTVALKKTKVFLRYLPRFKLLLCESCAYCVLPESLDRHLKDIHHLPITERDPLVDSASRLDLAPHEDIIYPQAGDSPIDGLPISKGRKCDAPGCGYLCITFKRMQAHWRTAHNERHGRAVTAHAVRCRPVNLQTFFRGSHLRYFVVSGSQEKSKAVDSPPRLAEPSSAEDWRTDDHFPKNGDSFEISVWYLRTEFCQRSYSSLLPVKSAGQSWRNHMVQISSNSDFLRYALLSVLASHVAFEFPDSRQQYRMEADRFRLEAIRRLPTKSAEMSQGFFFAMFHFFRLMTMAYLAQGPMSTAHDEDPDAVVPAWIHVQRKGRAIIWPDDDRYSVSEALQGNKPGLIAAYQMPNASNEGRPHLERLSRLHEDLSGLSNVHVDEVCLISLERLRRVWAIPGEGSAVSLRDMALMWTARVPERFLELLAGRDPVALIVFAHFCALWSLSEATHWYMRGHGKTMLAAVARSLSFEWHGWIEWPFKVVYKHDWGELDVAEQ